MQLKHLQMQNFVGVREADVTFEKPVSLFVGRNNQGKTTIKNAVEFALTGKCRAMRFSKDVGNVIRGGDGMLVDLEYTDGNGEAVRAKRSKSTVGVNVDGREVLRYCLNPAEFIALPAKERAKILSEVLGGGMDEVIKAAIVEHVGDIDQTLLAELKGSGVNLLDIDAFREQIVQQRRSYKRLIDALPDKPPLLGDYELPQDYDVAKDEAAVKTLAERIAKGGQIIAEVRAMLQTKAEIADLQKAIAKLEASLKPLPKLPRGVTQQELEDLPVYLAILETAMRQTNDHGLHCCPVCHSVVGHKEAQKLRDDLEASIGEHVELTARRTQIENDNHRIEFELQTKRALLDGAQKRLNTVDVPKGAEELLAKYQAQRDTAQKRMAKYQLWQAADKAFQDAGKQRQGLTKLVEECNRIDEALKDGGPVKAAIAAGGRQLPINDSLLKLWDMEQLTWSDNGEIALRGIAIEYASASEQYRAGCVMGLALADVSGVGIAALDGFEVLDPDNANVFFEAITECHLRNVLVCASTDKDYSQVSVPDWLEVFQVEAGKVKRLS